jgi:hypothetical protein
MERRDATRTVYPNRFHSFGETSKTSKKIKAMIVGVALPTGFEPVF